MAWSRVLGWGRTRRTVFPAGPPLLPWELLKGSSVTCWGVAAFADPPHPTAVPRLGWLQGHHWPRSPVPHVPSPCRFPPVSHKGWHHSSPRTHPFNTRTSPGFAPPQQHSPG